MLNLSRELLVRRLWISFGDLLGAIALMTLIVAMIIRMPAWVKNQRPLTAEPRKTLDECSTESLPPSPKTAARNLSATAVLKSEFEGFGEGEQQLITYDFEDKHTRLYDLSGQEIAIFQGLLTDVSDDGRQLVTYAISDYSSRLYPLGENRFSQLSRYLQLWPYPL